MSMETSNIAQMQQNKLVKPEGFVSFIYFVSDKIKGGGGGGHCLKPGPRCSKLTTFLVKGSIFLKNRHFFYSRKVN